MTAEEARSELIRIAAELIRGDGLPRELSPWIEDHAQKTYSASRLCEFAAKQSERDRKLAILLRAIFDATRPQSPPEPSPAQEAAEQGGEGRGGLGKAQEPTQEIGGGDRG